MFPPLALAERRAFACEASFATMRADGEERRRILGRPSQTRHAGEGRHDER
jgi:hypothetical protein